MCKCKGFAIERPKRMPSRSLVVSQRSAAAIASKVKDVTSGTLSSVQSNDTGWLHQLSRRGDKITSVNSLVFQHGHCMWGWHSRNRALAQVWSSESKEARAASRSLTLAWGGAHLEGFKVTFLTFPRPAPKRARQDLKLPEWGGIQNFLSPQKNESCQLSAWRFFVVVFT